MKRLSLLLAMFLFCITSYSQNITKEFLVGEWESETVILNFKLENKKDLHISAYSTLTDNYFKIIGYEFNSIYFYLETLHEENNWDSIAKFIIIDENTMVADYVSSAPGQMIYKRK